MKLAQCIETDEPEVLSGAGTTDDEYLYRFKIVRSMELYESSPFQISERLQNFHFESKGSTGRDAEESGDKPIAPPYPADARRIEPNTKSAEEGSQERPKMMPKELLHLANFG